MRRTFSSTTALPVGEFQLVPRPVNASFSAGLGETRLMIIPGLFFILAVPRQGSRSHWTTYERCCLSDA